MPRLNEELAAAARRSLDRLAQRYRLEDRVLRAGDPTDEIAAFVHEQRPMMVVMGTHGRRGLARLFLGSVAARVLRQSVVPVLTVRPPPQADETTDGISKDVSPAERASVLVAVDFEETSNAALAFAKTLAQPLGADIVLAHVYDPRVLSTPELPAELVQRTIAELTRAARNALEELARHAGGLKSILLRGDPATEFGRVVEQIRPTLTVVGTHSRKGLRRFFLGSVAEHVVRQSIVPVLTVPTARES